MKKLLFLLAAWPLFAQSPVFTDFSPTVVGIAVGANHCTIWARLPGAWPTEVACYTGAAIAQIQVASVGEKMEGSFPMADGGIITWIILPSGVYQFCAGNAAGVTAAKQGTF
jgi:hypothetical protein